MKDIDCLIMAALKTDLAKEKYVLYRLRKDWALIVGEAAARHSQPYRLQHATLFIHTDNPSWSHNFLTMQGKLLAGTANTPVPNNDVDSRPMPWASPSSCLSPLMG